MGYRVLALDLATTTGWALHTPELQRPFFGAITLPGGPGEVGRRAERLRQLLEEKHNTHGPFTDIVFEAQHVAEDMQMSTVYMLIALGGMAEWFAYRTKARCFTVPIATWRKHFIGRGSGFKTRMIGKRKVYLPGHDPKELAITRCASFGWHTGIADAAEACGILDYYMHLLMQANRGFMVPWRDKTLFQAGQ